MKIHLRTVLFCLILIELGCAAVIGGSIYRRSIDQIRDRVSTVIPLQQKSLVFPSSAKLRHYYELEPNTNIEQDFSYMRLSGNAIHTINSDGLNEQKEYSVIALPRTYRIVSLGDSFTEGAFVDTKSNYSEVLEQTLNTRMQCDNFDQYEVINLGVAGYDMQYNLERYLRKGMKYNPDLILLWTDENDYISNNEKYYELSSTWNPTVEAPEIISLFTSEGDFAPEANAIWHKFNTLYTREELVTEELSALRELLSTYSGPMIIFSLKTIPADIRQSIQRLSVGRRGTYFFPEIPESYDKFPDNHPSVLGHKQFSEFLYAKMLSSVFTSCASQ